MPGPGRCPASTRKAMLAELDERIAYGELALRGVNERAIELDARLLANANTPMELLEAAVADWADEREDVLAVARRRLAGTRGRTGRPLVGPRPRAHRRRSRARTSRTPAGSRSSAAPVLTFLEPTFEGSRERRVLYETGEDVDFVVLPPSAVERLPTTPGAAELLARGYRVLVDRIGLERRRSRSSSPTAPAASEAPTQAAFTELANDYWYHVALDREEAPARRGVHGGGLPRRLSQGAARHAARLAREGGRPAVDTWHEGRFIERWADPGALVALEFAYGRYSVRDAAHGLWHSVDLWQGLEEETARRLGLEVELDHPDLRRRLAEVVPDPR